MNQFTASLWGDEAFSTVLAMRSPWEIVRIVARDTSPPLHPLLLHYWMIAFGTSEVAIRAMSFTFYVLTAVVVFFIGKSIWNNRVGVWAGLLAAVNPFLFVYAFEGRMYSLLLFTSTLSMYFFLTKRRGWHVLATTAALYTHHFSLLVIGVQSLWALGRALSPIKQKVKLLGRLWESLWPFGFAFLLYLPWLPALYFQTKMVTGGFWLGKPTLLDLVSLYPSFLVGTKENVITLIALGLVIAILALRHWQWKKWKDWFMISWFLLPIFLIWLFSQVAQSIFFDRYMLAMIPGALLLLSSRLRGWYSQILLGIFVVVLSWFAWDYFTHPIRRPFRELAGYVKQTKMPGDALVNWNSQAHHLWELKYYGIPGPIYAGGETDLPFFVGTAQMTEDDVIAQLPDASRIGVVYSGDPGEVEIPDYRVTDEQHFEDLTFQWWEKK